MAELISEIVGKEAYEQIKRLDEQLGDLVKKFENNARAALIMEQALAASTKTGGIGNLKKAAEDLNNVQAEGVRIANEVVETSKKKEEATKQYTDAINAQQKAELAAQQSATAWAAKEAKISADTVKQRKAETVSIASLTEENKKLRAERDKLDISTAAGRQKIKDLNEGIKENNRIILANQDVVKRQAANVGHYASATTNLDAETKKINETLGSFRGDVGKAWGALRQLANLLPGIGIAGIMGLAIDGVLALADSFDLLSNKTKEEIESAKVLSDVHKEMVKNIGDETTLLEVNYQTAVNTELSYRERGKAVDYLQKQYPEMFNNANREKLLNGELSGSYALLTNQIHQRAEETANLNLLNRKVLERTETQLQLDQLMGKGLGKDEFYYSNKSADVLKAKLGLQDREIGLIEARIQKNKEGFGKDVYYIDETVRRQVEAQNKIDKYYAEHGDPKKTGKPDKPKVKPEISPNLSDTDLADLKRYYENLRKAQIEAMGQMINDPESKKVFDEFLLGDVLSGDQSVTDAKAADLIDAITKRISEKAKKKEISLKFALDVAMINDIVQMATEALSTINDIQYQREIAAIDARDKKLKDSYDAEKKYIDSSFTNQADKERELAALEARREAQQKKIDRDRIAAQRKAAIAQKGYDIASIISGTAVAVISALGAKPYTPLNIAIAAGVAATGAANLARVIATPLPQYFKGTESKPQDGPAWVGEKGVEKITLPDGTSFLSPGTATIMDLPKQTVIKPHEETMKELMYDINASVFRKLGKAGNTMNSTIAAAFIESIEENTSEIKGLRKDMNAKGTNVSIYGDYNHHIHVQTNIR